MVSLEECLDEIDCFIGGIQKICVRCRNFEEVIGNIVLNLMPGFLFLEVH